MLFFKKSFKKVLLKFYHYFYKNGVPLYSTFTKKMYLNFPLMKTVYFMLLFLQKGCTFSVFRASLPIFDL